MTKAEADQAAAAYVLGALAADQRHYSDFASLPTEVALRVRLIEGQLRKRAVGGDKLTVKAMEKPVGRAVGMTPKQARKLGLPEK